MPPSVSADFIGDYGVCGWESPDSYENCARELAVATWVNSVSPQLVLAVGDLNMWDGEAGPACYPPPDGTQAAHIRQNNQRVYESREFDPCNCNQKGFPPTPYPTGGLPLYEKAIARGVFYATWGNHDWHTAGAGPAKEYFHPDPPYVIRAGLVDFIAVDSADVSKPGNPDGDPGMVGAPGESQSLAQGGAQWQYVKGALVQSNACWRVLYLHHPAYGTSDMHRKNDGQVARFVTSLNADPEVRAKDHRIDVVVSGHLHYGYWLRIHEEAVGDLPAHDVGYVVVPSGGDRPRDYVPQPDLPPGVRDPWNSGRVGGFVEITAYPPTAGGPARLRIDFYGVDRGPAWWDLVEARLGGYRGGLLRSFELSRSTGAACQPLVCRRPTPCQTGTPIATKEFGGCTVEPTRTATATGAPTATATPTGAHASSPQYVFFVGDMPVCRGDSADPRPLMQARITFEPCCPFGGCQFGSGLCPYHAVAQDRYGRELADVCCYLDVWQGEVWCDSGCIFTPFSMPYGWTIVPAPGTTYQPGRVTVRNECCGLCSYRWEVKE